MFKLGISSDLDQVCTLTREWGTEHIELRTILDQNILALSLVSGAAYVQVDRSRLDSHDSEPCSSRSALTRPLSPYSKRSVWQSGVVAAC